MPPFQASGADYKRSSDSRCEPIFVSGGSAKSWCYRKMTRGEETKLYLPSCGVGSLDGRRLTLEREATVPDMLVKLYDLPEMTPVLQRMAAQGIAIRPPTVWDRRTLIPWVKRHFGNGWVPECECAFRTLPPSCLIAVREQTLLGFACYDCTAKNFFGPTSVAESARGNGIGTALLLSALSRMKADGYGYAIIGGVGPAAFYAKTVGACVIEGSSPGIYSAPLTRKRDGAR